MSILRGVLGATIIIALAVLLSSDRKRINWRTVVCGLGIQFVLAALVLEADWFEGTMAFFSSLVVKVLGFATDGASFVFGSLVEDTEQFGFIFCFQVLPMIIFVSALTSVLYYLGVLQRVVIGFAWVMTRAMRLSGAESLAAAANVFVGQTEAPLVVRPYIPKMSRSEIMALMTGGFATIAGSVLGAYILFLGGADEASKAYYTKLLLCASLMNAPAALVLAKLLVPETEKVASDLSIARDSEGTNVLDAMACGTTNGLRLALNVGAMLLVFVAVIAMVDWFLVDFVGGFRPGGGTLFAGEDGYLNRWVADVSGGRFPAFSLDVILGVLGAPFAWVIGVEGADVLQVGQLLGKKLVFTEFIAYQDLGSLSTDGKLSERSVFLATFALCGFANFGSIGIQLGGIGGMAPERRPAIASLVVRAMFGGALASLLSASLAGLFF